MRDKNPVIMGLIGALLLSTPAVAATADDFTDFPSDWSAPALSQAVENGLLNGYDGKINPTGLLTRAQMATMVNRAFGATATASLSGYEDVAPTDWYYEELAKAVQMGTFQGDNGALRPNQPITREQAFAKLLPRTHPGAVVLLHSTSKTNAEILDELLTKWEEEGYRFATVEELFAS